MINAVSRRAEFKAIMFCVSSGYPGQAIRLKNLESSLNSSLVSITCFSPSTIRFLTALRPKYGTPFALLPLIETHEFLSVGIISKGKSSMLK